MNDSEDNILLTPLKERDEICGVSSENKENIRKLPPNTRKLIYQFAAVLSVSLVTMGFSVAEHWTSPALPHLRSKESGFSITSDQSSLIFSLLNIGTVLGVLIFPILVNKSGPKYSLLILTLPQIISYIMIYLAKSVTTLYIARFMSGFGYGPSYVAQIMYVGEIADKNIRGTLMFITRLFYLFGTIFLLTLGAFLSYETMNLIILSIPILFIATFIFMPDSPYFYLKSNRDEEAYNSLSKLRGIQNPEILNKELRIMKESVEHDGKNQKYALQRLFEDERQRRALLIITVIQTGLILTGGRAFSAIGQDIFSSVDSFLSPQYIFLIIMIIACILCLTVARLVDRFGRRLTLLTSSIICSLSLISIGLIFFLKYYHRYDISTISWIPCVAMIIYEISCISGLLTTTVVLIGELFSPQVKSTALTILIIFKEIFVFLTKFSHAKLVSLIGIYSVFWIYSCLCFTVSLIGFLILPETKGKTLEEIQILLDKRKNVHELAEKEKV